MRIARRWRFLVFGCVLGHLGLGMSVSADTLVPRQ